jgi:hypothetical protein
MAFNIAFESNIWAIVARKILTIIVFAFTKYCPDIAFERNTELSFFLLSQNPMLQGPSKKQPGGKAGKGK